MIDKLAGINSLHQARGVIDPGHTPHLNFNKTVKTTDVSSAACEKKVSFSAASSP